VGVLRLEIDLWFTEFIMSLFLMQKKTRKG